MAPTIGQQLQNAREARKLSLEDVSKATHMRTHYLQALEEGDYQALPSETQARGFMRTYASYLGLDASALLVEMDAETTPQSETTAVADQPDDRKPVTDSDEDSDAPDAIFIEVGKSLKKQRETLGLSLEDVERHTNLRQHYLMALEAGDLDGLPSPVQARGMLSNYTIFLGMDPDPVLIRFAEGLQARLAIKQDSPERTRGKGTRRKTVPRPVRRILSNDLIIGGSIVTFLVIFIVWAAIRVFAMQSNKAPEPTAPSIVDVLLASPSPSPTTNLTSETPTGAVVVQPDTPDESPVEATAELPLIFTEQEDLEVQLTVVQRAWLKVIVDGEVAQMGRVLPGSFYSFSGESQIEVITGNGQAILVIFNQQNLDEMGVYGQVVDWIFTREGRLFPTPTITPTPTLTPRVTPTAPLLPGAGTPAPPAP